MNPEFEQPTELEKQRTAYFNTRAKPNMVMDEFIRLNEEVLRLFPITSEEFLLDFERKKKIPEFVL